MNEHDIAEQAYKNGYDKGYEDGYKNGYAIGDAFGYEKGFDEGYEVLAGELQCAVGDTIFEADGEHGVVKHEIYEICVVFKTTATDDKGNKWDDYWTSEDIGDAYKTRNEAEASLPQLRSKNGW